MSKWKFFIIANLVLCAASLFARGGGGGFGGGYHGGVGGEYRGGGEWGAYHPRYYDRRYVDSNYYYYGMPTGYYTGAAAAYPYVYSSPPGISDDSDALYESYLQHNGQGY